MSDSAKLKNYLDGIPHGQYREKRALILKRCYIKPAAFSHWISGRNNIPPLAKKEIEKIANRQIF